MTYNEMYANAIYQLGETYGTPDYAEAKENFYKVFELLAVAGCVGRVEDCRLCPEDGDPLNHETLADFERDIEILKRVNYPRVNELEEDLQRFKAQLA